MKFENNFHRGRCAICDYSGSVADATLIPGTKPISLCFDHFTILSRKYAPPASRAKSIATRQDKAQTAAVDAVWYLVERNLEESSLREQCAALTKGRLTTTRGSNYQPTTLTRAYLRMAELHDIQETDHLAIRIAVANKMRGPL